MINIIIFNDKQIIYMNDFKEENIFLNMKWNKYLFMF